MSSVLHPVGPEPRERYWVRRLAVLVAIVVAVGIVVALVGNAMSAGSAVQAEPAQPTYVPPVFTPSPSPTPAPTPSRSASPTASPSPSATPSPTSSTSSGAKPSASPTPTSSPTAKSTPSATPSASTKKDKAEDKAKGKPAAPAAPTACVASDLRPAITGDRTVAVGKKTTFALSLVNGSKKTCTVGVQPSNATLTIVSGSDRIWGTNDCPAALPATKRTVRPGHALNWKVTWSGERSGAGCSTSQAAPKKGYYWAIAHVEGADEVRFRVILS